MLELSDDEVTSEELPGAVALVNPVLFRAVNMVKKKLVPQHQAEVEK